MNKILVSGLLNVETSVMVDAFPIEYAPIEYPFFGVDTFVSGVGFNLAKALKTLGSEIDLLGQVGNDLPGSMVCAELNRNEIDTSLCRVIHDMKTPTSVVLVDKTGKRKIYCDLKDIQDRPPLDEMSVDLTKYSLVALTNINFNRKLLNAAKIKGVPIATDVHVLGSLDDEYNQDFLQNADILFLSNEAIRGKEGDFLREIYQRFHNEIIVCGCGEEGALMYLGKEGSFVYAPAVAPYGVVSTVGAGDALFASFLHFYSKGNDLESCLKKAVLFAGIMIHQKGGSNGFVSEAELERLFAS